MLARYALIACTFLALPPAIASEPALSGGTLCKQTLPVIRETWQRDLYDAPPVVAAVMVDAIDGKLPRVRQGLAALPAAEQAHWRQVAMLTAANAYQPTVVDGLLDDGAAVDGTVRLPPLKTSFMRQIEDGMARDPRFGPGAAKGLEAAGLMRNAGNLVGPALIAAVGCGDTATVDVLLRHHADVMARQKPDTPSGALLVAMLDGNAPIVSRLLDHGADVCAEDRLIRKPGASLASIARHRHLPDALVQRLTCHAPAAAAP
ncbi:MAG: hypothetical protein BGP10_02335 [Rhodanobacter sp. 68-29]|nr:hypothetical protein [Rhodanobacter sp.]ODU74825.1 MAG: hypothetical protein ABT17_06140 [Rhodanobacter sp. SCN 69-32]OJY58487.1 MAG: hypothetical protein BGP10_02335 [Rhodanobacter sp. 68-29]